jgi:hypothetical protein
MRCRIESRVTCSRWFARKLTEQAIRQTVPVLLGEQWWIWSGMPDSRTISTHRTRTDFERFYKMTPTQLRLAPGSLTGLDGTLSQTMHARHVYGAGDIRWGALLRRSLPPRNRTDRGTMDLDSFDAIDEASLSTAKESGNRTADGGVRPGRRLRCSSSQP